MSTFGQLQARKLPNCMIMDKIKIWWHRFAGPDLVDSILLLAPTQELFIYGTPKLIN